MAYSAETHRMNAAKEHQDHDEESSFSYAMQLVNSTSLPMSLKAAIELRVFEIIARAGPNAKLSPQEIASQIATHNPDAPKMLDSILRLLATYSVVSCSLVDVDVGDDSSSLQQLQRVYGLAPVTKFFIPNEDGVSLAPLLALVQDNIFLQSWSELKEAIVEGGIPFNRVHGTHAFEYPGKDPRFNKIFNTAMLNQTTMVMKKTLKVYNGFEHVNRLVDVGGGLGVSLSIITSKYPSLKGINFDLPHVIANAPLYHGVEHVGGDMFESVPQGDAVFMKWILHDWSDDHCLKLLKNCYRAIPKDGKVIVMDAVLPVLPETTAASKADAELDVVMMTQNPGGKERTKPEFEALATKAGFNGIRYKCFVCNTWVMEFFK